MAYCLAVRPAGGDRTWTVVDASYATVGPVEEWLEAHRHLWSPNTVRGYATGLAQWWTFLEQRDDTTNWDTLGLMRQLGAAPAAGSLTEKVGIQLQHLAARRQRSKAGVS